MKHILRDLFSSTLIMISFGTANHPRSNWYYRARLQHSRGRGRGKYSSPTGHLCFNNKNIGKTVTEYQLPFPLPPSITREMITDLFPEASEVANLCYEIFIWRSHQQSTDDPWNKTLWNYKATQYRGSDCVYVGGRKYNWDKIRQFLEIKHNKFYNLAF